MRAYADSSFVLRMVVNELDSEAAIAEYRRALKPRLFFLPLHQLEVRNAILQRAFHPRRSDSGKEIALISRERDAAFSRLEMLLARQTFFETVVDMDEAMAHALRLSTAYTERLGARAIDLLHVAYALTLESELFFTTDLRQAQLAKAEGLKVAPAI